jgi:hypothetical protein
MLSCHHDNKGMDNQQFAQILAATVDLPASSQPVQQGPPNFAETTSDLQCANLNSQAGSKVLRLSCTSDKWLCLSGHTLIFGHA